jgi:hypothetical protein
MASNVNNEIAYFNASSKNSISDSDKRGIIVVDPNKVFEEGVIKERNVPQEELVMFVDLKARLNPRNRIIDDGNSKTLVDVASFKSYKAMNPKNPDGTDKGFFTTDWTEMFEQTDVKRDTEGLGIENINIEINASLTPQVNITFIDVRGQNLLIKGDDPDSPYNLFYNFPYPLFILTFKGYYGKAVSYPLMLEKVETEFDSGSGDFRMNCTFHSYTFALLNDLNLIYGHLAPYMYSSVSSNSEEPKYEGLAILREIYQNQASKYQGDDLIEKPFTIYELIDSLNNVGKSKEVSNLVNDIKILKNNISKFNNQLSIFKNLIQEDTVDAGVGFDANNLKNIIDSQVESIKNNKLFKEVKGKYNDNFVTVNTFLDEDGFTLTRFNQIISDLKKNVENYNNKITLESEERITKNFTNELGFRPSIKNIVRIFLNNIQAFVELLNIKSIEAYLQCTDVSNPAYKKRNDIQILNGDYTKIPITGTSNENKRIFPFPNYYKKSDDVYEKIFPGEDGINYEWEEVKFVKEFYKAQINIGQIVNNEPLEEIDYDEYYTDTSPNGLFKELLCRMSETIFSFNDFYDYRNNKKSLETRMREEGRKEANILIESYLKRGHARRNDLIGFYNQVFKDKTTDGFDNMREYALANIKSDLTLLQESGFNKILTSQGTNRFGESETLSIPSKNSNVYYLNMNEDFSDFEEGKIIWREDVILNKTTNGKKNKLFNSIFQNSFLENSEHKTNGTNTSNVNFFKKMILGNQKFNVYSELSDQDLKEIFFNSVLFPSTIYDKLNGDEEKYDRFVELMLYFLDFFFKVINIEITKENVVLLNGWIRYFLNLIYKKFDEISPLAILNLNTYFEGAFYDEFLVNFKKIYKNFEELSQSYLNGFESALSGSFNEGFKKPEKKVKGKVDTLKNIESVKTKTYYNIKTIYDNWISSNQEKDNNTSSLFFNFYNLRNNGENEEIIETREKDLIEYFSFLDRGNSDIGADVIVDINWLVNFFGKNLVSSDAKNLNISYYTFFSELASHHGFLIHALPNFINFDQSNDENIAPQDVFGVFDYIENIGTTPSFIFQYIGDSTSTLNTPANKNVENKTKSFTLDHREQQLIEQSEIPNDMKGGNATAFIVNYGNQEQQIFSDVMLNQAEYQNTEEAYDVITRIAQGSIETPSANLYQIYTQRSFTAQVSSMGNAMIQPMMFFYLKGIPLFYGTYWITHVSHSITPNNIKTDFKGVRQPISVVKPKNRIMLDIVESYLKTLGIESALDDDLEVTNGLVKFNDNDLDKPLGVNSKFKWRDLLLRQNPISSEYNKTYVEVDSNTYRALSALYTNVIRHIENKFPDVSIVSALRRSDINGSSNNPKSQHYYGEAVDLQFFDENRNVLTEKNKELFYWAAKNLPYFDQLIWETDNWVNGVDIPPDGAPRVVHISLNVVRYPNREQRYERKALDNYGNSVNNKSYYYVDSDEWRLTPPKKYIITEKQEEYFNDTDIRSGFVATFPDRFGINAPLDSKMTTFMKKLESGLGVTTSNERLRFLYAWNQAEADANIKKNAAFNPFNTSLNTGEDYVDSDFNDKKVKNYLSLEAGVSATIKTLKESRYSELYDAIIRGESAMEMAEAAFKSPWKSGRSSNTVENTYVIEVLNKSSKIVGRPLATRTYQTHS